VRGAGTATITARQEGDASYLPAEATCVLLVRKARQTIIFPSPARPPFSTGATFELSARATQGGSVTYAAQPEGIVSISGSTVTMLAPGKVKIIATQSGTPNYEAVSVPKTLMFR
jgi:ABC-type Fe3+-hydroxamate transport system substrate-binding protein